MTHTAQGTNTMRKLQTGFTMIEIMIVVAIVGILAAIAIPNYREYIMRSRIVEATTTLSSQRVRMEQYFQDNRTYVGACSAGTAAPPMPTSDYFTFACGALAIGTYTLTATGKSSGAMSGFTYTLDQANTRQTTALPTGWGTAPVACWVLKKGGQC